MSRAIRLVLPAIFALPAAGQPSAPEGRALPLVRLESSRAVGTDSEGYYRMPAGLADDYPEESTNPEKIRRDLETARAVGAPYLRFGIGWDAIEKERGRRDWLFWDTLIEEALRAGITPLPYVCYTPRWAGGGGEDSWRRPPADSKSLGRFMRDIAARYKGRIKSWEIWNEPDLDAYWKGSAEQFAVMAEEAARQVRAADPRAVLVLGGSALGRDGPFFETLLERRRLGRYFDVVNMHRYPETWTPDLAEELPDKIADMAALVEAHGGGAELWLAEFGYSSRPSTGTKASEWVERRHEHEHTAAYQAVMLWKLHVLALASGRPSLVTWYRINDLPSDEAVIGDDNNRHLGILDERGRPKPAYHALRLYNELLGRHPTRPLAGWSAERPAGSQAVLHVFERKDGRLVVTGWLRSVRASETRAAQRPARDARLESVTIRLGKDAGRAKAFDPRTGLQVAVPALTGGRLGPLELSGDRAFIALIEAP